jgi:hypothetical protein
MTKAMKNRETSTLVSLMSIIQNSKDSASEGVEIYLEYAKNYQSLRTWFKGQGDQSEVDSIEERELINFNRLLGWVALEDLIAMLESNPLPAKRARFFAVACHLMPQVALAGSYADITSGRLNQRGRRAWAWIFNEFELPREFNVVFPVSAEDVNVESVERELLRIAGGRDILPVKEAREVLHWGPRSETYRKVKSELENRGWEWKRARVEGVIQRVICVPSVNMNRCGIF